MASYTVGYTSRFLDDLGKATEYIAVQLHNDIAAADLYTRAIKLIGDRADAGDLISPAPYFIGNDAKFSRIKVKNYFVIYEIDGNKMIALRFLHSSQSIREILASLIH